MGSHRCICLRVTNYRTQTTTANALLLQARDAKQTATNAWTDAQAHLVKAGQTAFAARMDANLAQFRKATAACDPAMEVAALATSDADNMSSAAS